ncbi:MAG TPA: hypothetical protein P5295_10150 [Spirochaetota bacterium]|nr:hypothetical protein [Spirochaetota bacterium]
MQALKNIGIDLKLTAVFGVTALVLSLLTGIVSGISGSVVAVRSILMAIVFSVLGYAAVFVVKRFVPEFYEMIADRAEGLAVDVAPENKSEDAGTPSVEEEDNPDAAMYDEAGAAPGPEARPKKSGAQDEGFAEFKEADFPRMASGSTGDTALNATLQSSDAKKYGKHILVKDEFVRYEPKLMADAVRTMLRKDED